MRKLCPICDHTERREDWSMDFLVPDGWTLPTHNVICECANCGFVWYDNDRTQADYDRYYAERYGYGTDYPEDRERLTELAHWIADRFEGASVIDFGGGEGFLIDRLRELGFTNVGTLNVGDDEPEFAVSLVVASHVIEHIYHLDKLFEKFQRITNAYLVIEIPDGWQYSQRHWPPIRDFHQKHVNHFDKAHLDFLALRFGFHKLDEYEYEFERYNAPCYRAAYWKEAGMVDLAKNRITANVEAIAVKLREITRPVIVWGCGDICLHALTKVNLNIVHFVDNDPAFRGATIRGIPVLDHVESDAPIVVLAQGQKNEIIDRIRKDGVRNEVIVI